MSIYSARCDNLTGGYAKFGKVVVISIQFRMLSAGTTPAMLTGFPTPLFSTGNGSVELNGIKTSSLETTGVYINPFGSLCVKNAVANDYISITGSYLSN